MLNFKKPLLIVIIASVAFMAVLSIWFAVNRARVSSPDSSYNPVFVDVNAAAEELKPAYYGSHGWTIWLTEQSDYIYAYFGQYLLRYDISKNMIDRAVKVTKPDDIDTGWHFAPDGIHALSYGYNVSDGSNDSQVFLINFDNSKVSLVADTLGNLTPDKLPSGLRNGFDAETRRWHSNTRTIDEYSLDNNIIPSAAIDRETIGSMIPMNEESTVFLGYYKFVLIDAASGRIIQECPINIGSLDDTEPQSVETVYSPDGKYYIEGYGVDYSMQVSGLNPIKQFRIVEAANGKTVWLMDGPYLLISNPPFAWSPDGRYVYIAYAGRTWQEVVIVDTTDMSEHPLPGISELAALFPGTTPDDNRPDPYIVPFAWRDTHTLAVTFSWRVKENLANEENRLRGKYLYDTNNGDFTLSLENALISVDYTADELLIGYDSFNEFDDEGYQKIIFTTNIGVRSFRYIEIGYNEDGTSIKFYEKNTLYSLDELLPDKPIVVTWMEVGTIPHRGISYVDENNITRYFYITMSGKDDSLLLVEF